MLRVLIVDDEPLARRGLRQLLAVHPGVAVAGEAGDVAEALEIIAAERPDVVFLDIELGEETENGFALIARLEAAPRIVCVTAHARHAVEAFAVAATDFLLKPVSPQRLAETLARLERQAPAAPEPMTLRTPGRTVVVAPADIAALRADGDFTHVLLVGQAPLMILRTLAAFEAVLPAPPFLRVGRSLILNRDRLRAVEMPAGGGQPLVRLAGLDEPVPLGRSAALRLRAALAGRTGTV